MSRNSLQLYVMMGFSLAGCAGPTTTETPVGEAEDPVDVTQSTTAADGALTAAKADLSGDPEFAASMGLTATASLDSVSLTKVFIHTDELHAWTAGTPVGTLFHAPGLRLFLVLDGDTVVSAMVMGKNPDGSWREVSTGHGARAPKIAAARAASIEQLGEPERPMFIVTAPALYAEFVSQRKGDILYLTPVFDVAGLPAGTPVPAQDAMTALQAVPIQADSVLKAPVATTVP